MLYEYESIKLNTEICTPIGTDSDTFYFILYHCVLPTHFCFQRYLETLVYLKPEEKLSSSAY
jgi:hypothetical protein